MLSYSKNVSLSHLLLITVEGINTGRTANTNSWLPPKPPPQQTLPPAPSLRLLSLHSRELEACNKLAYPWERTFESNCLANILCHFPLSHAGDEGSDSWPGDAKTRQRLVTHGERHRKEQLRSQRAKQLGASDFPFQTLG